MFDSGAWSVKVTGRDWLGAIKLWWAEIGAQLYSNKVNGVTFDRLYAIKKLKQKHTAVFKKELGTLKSIKGRLTLKEGVVPKTTKSYEVPLTRELRLKVNMKV